MTGRCAGCDIIFESAQDKTFQKNQVRKLAWIVATKKIAHFGLI